MNFNHLSELENRLNYSFKERSLLQRALTHSSFAHEANTAASKSHSQDYESLEFLGDSILEFLISDYLFREHVTLDEGKLSKIRSFLVSSRHLASLSQSLGLGDFLRLGYGEEKSGGREKIAILADLFESLVAAIYLDGGLEPTRRFVFTHFALSLENITRDTLHLHDRKSLLQEKLHRRGLPEPTYRVIAESGPDHAKKFLVEVSVRDRCLARGEGRSKKQAEQKAARLALEILEKEPP